MDPTEMTTEIRNAVSMLRRLDSQRQIFGANAHQWTFGPRVSERAMLQWEREQGAPMPADLRAYYTALGDGGPGLNYGVRPLQRLTPYQVQAPYPGASAYLAEARENPEEYGFEEDEEGPYYFIPAERLRGLIAFEDEGCGHQTAVVSAGVQAGRLVFLSGDGELFDGDTAFLEALHAKFQKHLNVFARLQELVDSSCPLEELTSTLREETGEWRGMDLMVSLLSVEKPAKLFGSGSQRIYHGKTQIPWYQSVLQDYRDKRS